MFTTKFYDIFSGKTVEFKTKPKVRAPEPSLHRPGITVLEDGKMQFTPQGAYPKEDKPKIATPPAAPFAQLSTGPTAKNFQMWQENQEHKLESGWYLCRHWNQQDDKDDHMRYFDGTQWSIGTPPNHLTATKEFWMNLRNAKAHYLKCIHYKKMLPKKNLHDSTYTFE